MSRINESIEKLKICIIIPTYNNATTLKKVIEDVSQYSNNIIVVNDGSTDDTLEILSELSYIDVISYENNVGKGFVLRKGFEYAIEKGYKYAITIDADGQHFAEDIPLFIDKLKEEKDAVIIGARNMTQDGVPGKSSFGHKFSNFWFRVETGIKHPDTQSGFRLYPLDRIKDSKWFTKKYEFEIEVIVRLAWKGVKITYVPIKVYYAPKEERISHFRPFVDFTRISILNTLFVIFTFLYIKPRDFTKKAFSKSVKQHFYEQINNPRYSNLNLALSVAFGIFMGIIPIWGYQLVSAIFLAYLFKLNKTIVIISANISLPPLIPFILFVSVKTGELVLDVKTGLNFHSEITFEVIKSLLKVYVVGSIVLAIIMSLFSGFLSWFLLTIFRKKN
jgi:glycosyltransferase involved in cell wall biosynthesis